MARTRASNDEAPQKRRPAAKTPEARERELVGLAMDLAEKQLRAGTASAQVITHWLKVGSEKDKLEREGLRVENELRKAKVDQLASAQKTEELYAKALKAIKSYAGEPDEDEDYEG